MILLLLLTLAIFGIYLILSSKNLHQRFRELGNMSGMSLSEISSKIGKPSSILWQDEYIIARWSEGGLFQTTYSIELIFDSESKLIKIRSQSTY